MAKAKTSVKETNEVEVTDIIQVSRGRVEFCLLGTTPMILHRMSQKAAGDLLCPKAKKNAAEKASHLKHDPVQEFRDSPYTISDSKSPTLLAQLATCFKKSMGTAALDIEGVNKTQIGRLTYVEGERIPIYGVPKLFMSVVRCADINKTPDVRTRAIVPEWACRLSVTFATPLIRDKAITGLLATAGMTSGVGDWRAQKGAGNYGSWVLVSEDDPEFKRIVKEGGRIPQIAAMETPVPYDEETAELLSWFQKTAADRGFRPAA